MKRVPIFVCMALFALTATRSFSQILPAQAAAIDEMTTAEVRSRCSDLMPDMLKAFDGDDGLRAAFAHRPLKTDAICSCAVQTAKRENRLQKMLANAGPAAIADANVVGNQISSYILLLILQSTYTCLGSEMARTAETAPLPR